jgi:hypothetical protein
VSSRSLRPTYSSATRGAGFGACRSSPRAFSAVPCNRVTPSRARRPPRTRILSKRVPNARKIVDSAPAQHLRERTCARRLVSAWSRLG